MKLTPAEIYSELRSTYWFVPSVLTLAAAGLAVGLQLLDRRIGAAELGVLSLFYPDSVEGLRALLGAIVGSVMTVVSVTFSVTIVALTVSSQHFGPRLLNAFMRDTPAQVVLGIFIGTFGYSVLVLGALDGDRPGVPHLSSLGSVVLVLLSVGALIYFIHHISSALGAPSIAERLAGAFVEAVGRLYPHFWGEAGPDEILEEPSGGDVAVADQSGYVQRIDEHALVMAAAKRQAVLRLRRHAGDFVVRGAPLVEVHPAGALDDELRQAVNDAYVLGPDRTTWQDPEFAIKQLVEVALHALSPSLNEPFTAITCIDRLTGGLGFLAQRPRPSRLRRDEDGRLRLIADRQTFQALLRVAFDPIRLASHGQLAVSIRLLDAVSLLANVVTREDDRRALRHQARVVHRSVARGLADRDDRAYLEARYRAAVSRLA